MMNYKKIKCLANSELAIFLILSVFLVVLCSSCGKKTQYQAIKQVAPQTPKQEIPQREEVDWRSIQTIDAHDERDTIVGNFTGMSIDSLWVMKKEIFGESPVVPIVVKYYMVSNNKRIPWVELYGIWQAPPKLVNEGDLDGNGTCEVGYLHTYKNSQWRQYRIFTLRNGKWRYLVEGEFLDTEEWFRHVGVEVAQPGPRKGTVLIHYGVSYGDGSAIIKDTIVKPSFSRITD